jgi:plastocyanin
MKPVLIILLLAATFASVRAGTISGTVRAQGKPGAEADARGGKYDSREFKFVEHVNYTEMRDFVVYIEGPLPGSTSAPPAKPVEIATRRITQKGALFSPHVLPIMVGTTVEWPNYDDIMHNVFSESEAARFDLGLYKSGEKKPWKFEKPGRVDVFCSIHTRMSCIVLVLENPYFATTDGKGKFAIQAVPSGTYKLKAWHERLPSKVQEIKVPETGEIKVDFTLGITGLPTP